MAVQTVQKRLQGESRVLVLAPVQGHEGLCGDALTCGDAGERHVLLVTDRWTPAEIVADWRDHQDSLPETLAVVCPGRPDPATADLPSNVHATGVPADDLTGLTLAVSRYLDVWGAGASAKVCVDALGPTLPEASRDDLSRVLHTLTDRFLAAGATAHVHVDPAAHDDGAVASLQSLFDTVVRPEDGEWTVERS